MIRVFANPEVAHVREDLDPRADVELVETELVLGDLELVERRVDKTRKAARSGDKAAQHELAVLEALVAGLEQGRLARSVERAPEDAPLFRELALVSDRPVLFVLNTDDDRGAGETLARARRRSSTGRAAGATRWSPSPRASRPSWPTSNPEEAAEFRAELGADDAGAIDVLPARRLRRSSATSRSSPATSAAASRAPGSCRAAGPPSRPPAASTATSSTASCAPRS